MTYGYPAVDLARSHEPDGTGTGSNINPTENKFRLGQGLNEFQGKACDARVSREARRLCQACACAARESHGDPPEAYLCAGNGRADSHQPQQLRSIRLRTKHCTSLALRSPRCLATLSLLWLLLQRSALLLRHHGAPLRCGALWHLPLYLSHQSQ